MTDPVLRLEPDRSTVEPGGQVRVAVTITNPGTIVESYALDVVSETPLPWVEVVPPVVSVYPQQQEMATVVFSPPGGPAAPGGTVPYGVRARSQVESSASAVVEGELEVGQVHGLQAKLTPVTSSGRWRGLHAVQISNWGNAPARLRLVGTDPDQALGFLIRPGVVDVPLGGTVTARVKVRARKPVLRGSADRLPFQLVGEPDPPRPTGAPVAPGIDPGRPVLDGTFVRKPIVTRGFVTVAGLVGVALVGLLVFALTRGGPADKITGDGTTVPTRPALRAQAVDPTTIGLTWELLRNVDSYILDTVDPVSSRTKASERGIDSQQSAKDVTELKPGTTYCFRLRAVNGELTGPASNRACATTPRAAPSAGPSSAPADGQPSETAGATTAPPSSPADGGTPGQSTQPTAPTSGGIPPFQQGDWIAVVQAFPAGSSADVERTARDIVQRLTKARIKAGVVHAKGQYPGLTKVGKAEPLADDWVVYVGPEVSPGEATATCESPAVQKESGAGCLTVQPAKAPAR